MRNAACRLGEEGVGERHQLRTIHLQSTRKSYPHTISRRLSLIKSNQMSAW